MGKPGSLVTSSVRLLEPLGAGGMGRVWLAEHLTLDTRVAVKLLSSERRGETRERAEARFAREAGLAARLKSPHAVRIYDYGVTDDGQPFIVMELLEGESLAERLRRGPLTPAETATLVKQLCLVLGSAHAEGIVHRDIKPDNIFLVASPEYDLFVKLLDFGIAKALRDNDVSVVTETGAMVGTPHYMSPEQLLDGKRVDPRADLWATGVVAYHALTGRRPFTGDTMAALSLAICHGDYDPPSDLIDDCPEALDAFFGRALSVVLEDRFASAAELAGAFCAAVGELATPDAPLDISAPATPPDPPDEQAAPTISTLGGATAHAGPRPSPRRWPWLPAAALLVAAGWLLFRSDNTDTARAGMPRMLVADLPPAVTAPEPARDVAPEAATSVDAPPSPAAPTRPTARIVPAKQRPAYCDGDDGYDRDARGHLVPKRECL